jgi:hypothetical protein
MSFTGNEDHRISLDEAIDLTKRYRDSVSSGTLLAGFFGKATLQRLIDQKNGVGIRIYLGKTSDNAQCFVLVGATKDEKDLYSGELAEISTPCPPFCDMNSPLVKS